ncbi:MAG TPA: 3'(2'),5'-bisphosphate nucleotidase CysQ [Labilithrix sp.]|nr:3'(2'),5'-bisphosphate nucleotidase CysQ [Labilithrix sp.]
MIDRQDVLSKLLDAAAAAAEVVMRVYAETDFGVELKGPNDPVTRADKEANALLLERLTRDFPGVPIVAEESDPSTFAGFGAAPHALFVDPVDGTRDFIAKTGEFAVMLGFAEAGSATVGVVDCPALGERYGAAVGSGAFRITKDGRTPIHVANATDLATARCAVSRFHRSKSVDAKLAALGLKELVPTGSAGIKGVRVATGALEIYAHPSTGLVKLWDACAPEAIVRAAGGIWTDGSGRAFDYRGPVAQNEGTLAANPTLHAEALRRFATVRTEG